MKRLIFLCFSILAVNIAIAQTSSDITSKLDNTLAMFAHDGWSGSALVASDGKILLEKGYGFADRESKRLQTAETVFSIGSITKQFTAAGILKLESQGLLSVDDHLSKYFSNVPADKSAITIHQLLTHSAGFDGAIGDDYENVSAEAFAELAFASTLLFSPGTQYNYSNAGYSLLGIIIAKISGQDYEKFLHHNLWKPAGMTKTGYLLPGHKPATLAVGYQNGERWGTALDKPWSVDGPGWHLRANGGVLSTVSDMYRWYVALRDHTVLPESATKKLFTPHIAEGPDGMSFYGYGWTIQELDGKRIIWHNGGNGVYNANMGFVPNDDICIIVSSNSNNVISDDISLQLLGITWGKELRIIEEDEPYMNNPVTNQILRVIREKGAEHFTANSEAILREAEFDFDNDMQLLGVGEQLMEAQQWESGIALYNVYTSLFPRIVVAWNHLGRCKKAVGDITGAKGAWEKSVSLRPQNNPAVKWLQELQ